MALLKFRTFEELDELEKKGKGINWNFCPDKSYYRSIFKYHVKVPFPAGVYKFKSFEEAQKWEINKWIEYGYRKRAD